MTTDLTFAHALAEAVRPAFPRERFRVFVFGPALQPTAVVGKPYGRANGHGSILRHARYLRYATKKELVKVGYPVDFGESRELIKLWTEKFRATDLGSSELLGARTVYGAIIVYPSSIGSVSELGMFAPFDEIAVKTLAIVHKRFKNDSSFFRNGLLKVLKQNTGSHEFIDYSNHRACLDSAVEFVDGRYQKLLRDYHDINRGKQKEAQYSGTAFQEEN